MGPSVFVIKKLKTCSSYSSLLQITTNVMQPPSEQYVIDIHFYSYQVLDMNSIYVAGYDF